MNVLSNIIINRFMLPETLIAGLACVVLLIDLIIAEKYKIINYILTQLGLLTIIVVIYFNFNHLLNVSNAQEENVFLIANGFILNSQINFLKLIIASLMLLIFIYAKNHFNGEYFVLNLLSILGVMVLISSRNFFNFYFGMEMFSMPIYTLIALESRKTSIEAALKYFILSAVFSGILLYGLSLIYGASGSLDFKSIINFIETQHISMLFQVGVVLMIIGIFFKLNLAPFHMWAPDVYQGSATSVTMLIASLPKIAIVSVLSYLLGDVFQKYINYNFQMLLIIIGILSMFVGNIGAILQTNIKRLLAYSAIGHVGFILLGLGANNLSGRFAANFYVVIYAFMIISVLGSITIFSNNNKFEDINNFSGLAKKYPWLSGILLVLLLSMAGIPPTLGFYGKFFIIKSLIDANLIWVAIVALLLSVISLYYYLKIIKLIYFTDSLDNNYLACDAGSVRSIQVIQSIAILSISIILIMISGAFINYINLNFYLQMH